MKIRIGKVAGWIARTLVAGLAQAAIDHVTKPATPPATPTENNTHG